MTEQHDGPDMAGGPARIVAVLDALARSAADGVGVRQLEAELGVSRSAIHRILRALTDLGVADALPSGRYRAGAVMVSWASFLEDSNVLLAGAHRVLGRLVDDLGETAYLLTYSIGQPIATVLTGVECDRPVRYVLAKGSTAPLDRGAAGKAILAHVPPEVATRILEGEPSGPRPPNLAGELVTIREAGYAASAGERIPEACGVAAPYYQHGVVAGSITVSVPRYRVDDGFADQAGPRVVRAAAELTRLLSVDA